MPARLARLALLALCTCSPAPDEAPAAGAAPVEGARAPEPGAPAEAEPGSALHDLRTAVAALAERPEHDARFVLVQHVLVGVGGASGRAAAEAELLAAGLFRRAQDGEPWRQLMVGSDDPGPGQYRIFQHERDRYAEAFGDAAWRLFPGEIGVVPYDPETAPHGYHVVQRIL